MYIKERVSYYCMYLILACVNNFAKLNGISSCFEGHFLGIRRGVELHQEEVTYFYYVYKRFFNFCRVFTFSNVFFIFI